MDESGVGCLSVLVTLYGSAPGPSVGFLVERAILSLLVFHLEEEGGQLHPMGGSLYYH